MATATDKSVSPASTGTICPTDDNALSVVHILLHRDRRGEAWREVDADPDPERLWDRFCSSRLGGMFLLRTRPANLTDAPVADG